MVFNSKGHDGNLNLVLKPVGHIRCDLAGKFGVPRQSGLVDALRAELVFCPPYRNRDALRGVEGFTHLWLIWGFHLNGASRQSGDWSPTVRPPRLGGNTRMGVFATRSPFRPNPLGLSCVRLLEVREDAPHGPVLVLTGADLADGTPVYDVKPYVPYADCRPEAAGGFAAERPEPLPVDCPPALLEALPEEKRPAAPGVLAQDPRPRYQDDPERVYGLSFAGRNVRFRVTGGRVEVLEISDNE